MEKIPKIYWKIQKLLLPNIKPAQLLYEQYLETIVNNDTIWLDLGCGHQLFRNWRIEEEKIITKKCKAIFGIDYVFSSLNKHKSINNRINGDIIKLPIKNNSFNLVTANMVIEHLNNPLEQFKEIARILMPGGLFILHTPNLYGYSTILSMILPDGIKGKLIKYLQNRKDEDSFKTHYYANTSSKIISISSKTELAVDDLKLVVEPVAIFAKIAPLAFFELLYIKLLSLDTLGKLRTNIICTLKKFPR